MIEDENPSKSFDECVVLVVVVLDDEMENKDRVYAEGIERRC